MIAAPMVPIPAPTHAHAAPAPTPWRTLAMMAIAGLGLRVLLGMWMPAVIIFDDEMTYAMLAREVVGAMQEGAENPWCYNPWGNVSALSLWAFGDTFVPMKVLNALMGVGTAFLMAATARRLYGDERLARAVLCLGLFLPPLVFLSATALKEQLIGTLIAMIAYGAVRRGWQGWLVAVVGLWLLDVFRWNLSIVVIPVVGLMWVAHMSFQSGFTLRQVLTRLALTLLVVEAGMLGALHTNHVKENQTFKIMSGLDSRGYATMQQSDAFFTRFLDKEHPFAHRNLVIAPLRSVYSPSPLRPLKTPQVSIVLESLIVTTWLCLAFPFTLLGVFRGWRRLSHWFPVALYGVVTLAAAYAALTYAQDTFRYRWADFPLYFMLAAYGWQIRHMRHARWVVGLWFASLAAFAVVYLR